MKKFLVVLCCLFITVFVIKLFIPNDVPSDISEIYDYCKDEGYSTEYCLLTDFSKPSGIKRFYVYSFKENDLFGLDSTNSNALDRGILIHNGNPEFETFPLPCLPVSKGCFAVSNSMMKHIENIKKQSDKPILLYAYN